MPLEITIGDPELGNDDETFYMLFSDGEEIGYYYPCNRTTVIFSRSALQSSIEKALRAKFKHTKHAIENTESISFEFD